MTGANPNLVGFLAIRGLTLLVGLAFAWMGYRLFVLGLTRQGGDLEIQAGQKFGIKLTRAAPGVFFALFGAAIIVYSITQVLQYSESPAGPVPSSDAAHATGGTPGSSSSGAPTTPSTPAKPPSVSICDTCAATKPHVGSASVSICDTCTAAVHPTSEAIYHPTHPHPNPATPRPN